MEWKKKAIEYENAYKETLQKLEGIFSPLNIVFIVVY